MNNKKNFIGRKKELQILKSLTVKNTASLVVIKGRRRIGKSRLAEEFGKQFKFISIAGNPPIDNENKIIRRIAKEILIDKNNIP